MPDKIKNRFSRRAVEDLLDPAMFDPNDDPQDQAILGLKSRLYPYQARSASLMIQRESTPGLRLDPRFDVRQSPTGEAFYYGARDGSFVKEPKFYEANRGGILAETMVSFFHGAGISSPLIACYAPVYGGNRACARNITDQSSNKMLISTGLGQDYHLSSGNPGYKGAYASDSCRIPECSTFT